MATLEELRAKKAELDKQQAEVNKQIEIAQANALIEAQDKAYAKIEALTDEQKDLILSMMKHDRSSCSDEKVFNGRWSASEGDGFRCRKCMLIEMFRGDHGGVYDFDLEVNIHKVKV